MLDFRGPSDHPENAPEELGRTCQFLGQLPLLSDMIPFTCNLKQEILFHLPLITVHSTILQGYPTEPDTVGIFPVCNGGESDRSVARRTPFARARARGPSHAAAAAKGRSVHGKCKRFSVTGKVKLK